MLMENCTRFEKCEATICPLDPELAKRTMIQGDKVCTYIIDFINAEPTPIDRETSITKDIWTAKIGEKRLIARAEGRKKLRLYWENRKIAENDPSILDIGIQGG